MPDETDPQDILTSTLENVEEICKALAEQGRSITSISQSLADKANAIRKLNEVASEYIDAEMQIHFWQDVDSQLRSIFYELEQPYEHMILTSGSSDTATSSILNSTLFDPGISEFLMTPEERETIKVMVDELYFVISRPEIREDALALLSGWGFDRANPGEKSAVELFQTAYLAFDLPLAKNDPVSTSLIPMRSCLEIVVEGLLRRRPTQEKASNNHSQIISIGYQLRRDGVRDDMVHEWANQWDMLKNDLSESKKSDFSRKEWGKRLNQATLFLSGFLKGLDPVKVRNTFHKE